MTVAAIDRGVDGSVLGADLSCAHCGLPSGTRRFCCAGCEVAFDTIQDLGLGTYYRQRILDSSARPPKPDSDGATAERWDLARFVTTGEDGACRMTLAVDELQCGACVWLIENVLARAPGVTTARVNMTTRRLRLAWRGDVTDAERLVARIAALGYRLVPFDPKALADAEDRRGRELIRGLAVAGFAAGNVMLFSIGTWAGLTQGMGPGTRSMLHWVSAIIAMPAIAYAGVPFFRSAWAALRGGRTNMDVPITIGVVLVTAISLVESMRGGLHTYFDSAVTLLFFLLLGRVLDHRARGAARATAEQLLMLRITDVAVLEEGGAVRRIAQESVAPGARVLVGTGERIGVDGVVEKGASQVDTSLVTGESVPTAAVPGTNVFAGTVNLGAALVVRTTATGAATLLSECVRLIEAAETRRGRFVVLADRVARRYAPAVHICALLTFLLWWLVLGASAADSLLIAASVLIITCPCALALAVPAVQVIATARLMRSGIMLKSGTALERLAEIDTVVLDKTGTLTEPTLAIGDGMDRDAVAVAASLAGASRHPLARALTAAAGTVMVRDDVVEQPGEGMRAGTGAGEIRLGSRRFCEVIDNPGDGPELWLSRPGHVPLRFGFVERLRSDAPATVERLRRFGLHVALASGDRAQSAQAIAAMVDIADVHAPCSPVVKVAYIEALRGEGRHVLMVGDGLNDAPSLAAAHVSISPSTAADVSQTVADVVFQGERLGAVADVIAIARRARRVMHQNLALSIGYNAVMLPLAVAGWVTPWLAAAAMSSSSIIVMLNSCRLQRGGRA